MTPKLHDFLTWFHVANMFPAERASNSYVLQEIKRYTLGDHSFESAIRADLFGEGGYLSWVK